MDKKVLRIDRCELCGMKTEYYVRDENVNIDLTDRDVRQLMTAKLEQPQSFDHCNVCELTTLTTTVGWIGV